MKITFIHAKRFLGTPVCKDFYFACSMVNIFNKIPIRKQNKLFFSHRVLTKNVVHNGNVVFVLHNVSGSL